MRINWCMLKIHNWTKWSNPKIREMTVFGGWLMGIQSGKKLGNIIERWQTRYCRKCLKIDERNISNP